MKPCAAIGGLRAHSRMTRSTGIVVLLLLPALLMGQAGGDKALRAQADAQFAKGAYAQAFEAYQTLMGNALEDFELNYRYGVCALHAGADKEEAIKYIKRSTQGPGVSAMSWYFLGRAYHSTYRFKEALDAYQRYKGTADKRMLDEHPVDALELQCRNGENLLSNLKDIDVFNKVEVERSEFFRYYDLGSIGGRIVVTPEELLTSVDKKSGDRNLIYLPDKPGPIWFASRGKGGTTGKDIYRTELLPNGTFAPPRKLAGYINTDQDEDFPFLAPDGKSFYFSSKGHNSMGGYDVFRSTYDAGMDVFGPPVNMDFAVNTPDDELLYLTDPEGKEACFASARDSRQDMVHVYRVGTTQAPVNITVLKGTFASSLDPQDRKAHIIVQDALTQETVADVRTDIDGDYVLAIPRSGRYRFLVEAGAGGRTHAGSVEVPRNDAPRAYRQEMSLVDQGGEKLVIKNYFEEPLQEDMIALAMDEIRRRARLDVGQHQRPSEAPADTARPVADVITRAGFAGDVTQASALRMAATDAAELRATEADLAAKERQSMALALQNLEQAERASKEAADLIARANALPAESSERNAMMTQAAITRQQARTAQQRAVAAWSAGKTYSTERMRTAVKAQGAEKLHQDLNAALTTGKQDLAVVKLVELRTRMEEKRAPEGQLSAAEQMRRTATEQERDAATRLQMANDARREEDDLADQLARKEREAQAAKGGKRETLEREAATLREQLTALHEETEDAFAKARVLEAATATARGQAELARHLEQRTDATIAAPDPAVVAGLGERIAGNSTRISELAVDERFEAAVAEQIQQAEQRTFDWGAATVEPTAATASTTLAVRQEGAEAQRAETLRAGVEHPELRTGEVQGGGQVQQPELAANTGEAPTVTRNMEQVGGPDGAAARDRDTVATAQDARTTVPLAVSAARTTEDMASAGGVVPATPVVDADTVDGRTVQDGAVEEQARPDAGANAEDEAFMLSNQLAELKQLRQAEKRRAVRDSLDIRIAETIARLRATEAEGTEVSAVDAAAGEARPDQGADERTGTADQAVDGAARSVEQAADRQEEAATSTETVAAGREEEGARSTQREAARFDAAIDDAGLVALVNAEHAAQRARIEQEMMEPAEKRTALHGLELMLIDSIDAESERQAALLASAPADKAQVLARMDRLRRLKEASVAEAERILAADDKHYAAQESRQMEDALLAGSTAPGDAANAGANVATASRTPHSDAYMRLQQDPEEVYNSTIEQRVFSKDVGEAVKERDAGLAKLADLWDRIDSLEAELATMSNGRAYDKLRERTDRLIDDAMIQRMELGQSMGFITKAEYQAAQDSVKRSEQRVVAKGLPANDPAVAMARDLKGQAAARMEMAARARKAADRTEDIVAKDSLLRTAYAEELQALRDMDRAATVFAFIASGDHTAGERLTYEAVEQRMFGADTGAPQPLAQAADAGRDTLAAPGGAAPSDQGAAQPDMTAGARTEGRTTDQPEQRGGAANVNVTTGAQDLLAKAQAAELAATVATDSANALQEGLPAARRSERETMQRELVRQRALSDSLNALAAVLREQADSTARVEEQMAADQAFRKRMMSFYYLEDEQLGVIMNEEDLSRYFAARSKALEQRAEADALAEQSNAGRTLAQGLLDQSKLLLVDTAGNGARLSAEEQQRASLMADQAVQLIRRADSIQQVADRLQNAARVNESQAATVLQSATPERGTEIMAMEQQARRAEPTLIAARAAATPEVPAAGAGEQRPATTAVVTAPPSGNTADASQAGVPVDNAQPATSTATVQSAAAAGGAAQTSGGRTEQDARTAEVPTTAAPANATPTGATRTDSIAIPTAATTAATSAPPTAGAPAAPAMPRLLAPLTADVFEIGAAPVDESGRIPLDVPMPQGIVFKVQVGAFRHEVPTETFKDMAPLAGEAVGNGLVRYTAGMFTSAQAAARATTQVRERGYRDAFVVAYQDGRRVPLAQAMRASSPATASVPAAQPVAEARPTPVEVRPVQPVATAELTDAEVLTKYPTTAEQLLAQFTPPPDATAYYNDPAAAPARQVETVKGLFYTVQVGVYSKPTALDKLFNITPLNSERTETNKIRYTTGVFVDMDRARARKDQTVALGVKDAFITAYLNGKRIPMRDARALVARFGQAVFADPSIVTR